MAVRGSDLNEGNSSLISRASTNQSTSTSLDHLPEPQITKKLTQESFHGSIDSSADMPKKRNHSLACHESVRQSIVSHSSTPDIVPPKSVAIEFNDLIMQRLINSNLSSLAANASQDSVADSLPVSNSLLSTPKSDLRPQSSFRRSLSRKQVPSTTYQAPTHSMLKRGSEDAQKIEARFSLVTSGILSKSPSHKVEDTGTQTPSLLAYLFLFPAYDYKGRHVTVESLAAFGKINPAFHINGIHPRSQFSNLWDLTLG
ncbi:hypothetical protein HDU81_002120, partial [Chytriomyces hyalinus]